MPPEVSNRIMPLGLLGKKLGMSQMFDDEGNLVPVTIIQAGPCPILMKREPGRDKYSALQLGFDPKPDRLMRKAEAGFFGASLMLRPASITNWNSFASKMVKAKDAEAPSAAKRVWELLPAEARDTVLKIAKTEKVEQSQKAAVCQAINGILARRDAFRKEEIEALQAAAGEAMALVDEAKNLAEKQVARLNRMVIEAQWPVEIAKRANGCSARLQPADVERIVASKVPVSFEAEKAEKALADARAKFSSCAMRFIREVRVEDVSKYEVGQLLDVTLFKVGDRVDVTGNSRGRGFIGPVKRHGSKPGPSGHGSMYHRRPGAMSGSSDPSRVYKLKPLAGRMGGSSVTALNIKVVKADPERNLLVVRGAVPGAPNGYVVIRPTVKTRRRPAKTHLA